MSIIFSIMLGFATASTAPEKAKAQAPIPQKIPAKADPKDTVSVRIRTSDDGDVVEEYMQGGVVSMVKVTPKKGKPYYIMDNNGDGRLDRADAEAAGGIVPVSWIIKTW
jgi:Protein of unknown function (DUF2782)